MLILKNSGGSFKKSEDYNYSNFLSLNYIYTFSLSKILFQVFTSSKLSQSFYSLKIFDQTLTLLKKSDKKIFYS